MAEFAYNYMVSLSGTEYDPCSYNLLHMSDNPYGENLAAGTNSEPAELVQLWYDEIEYYDYDNVTGIEHDGHDVGHFTQLVWADSTELGCAVQKCSNEAVYLICEYNPAGNIIVIGAPNNDEYIEFEENVKPLIS